MKKTLRVFLVGLLVCANLVGCSSKGEEGIVQTQTEVKQELTQEEVKKEVEEEIKEEIAESNPYEHLILEETETSVTFIDGEGNERTITKKPEKTVVLLNSILDLWYLVGGESLARVNGEANLPEAAVDLPNLGSFNKVSIEAILALEPDLVLLHTTNSQTQFCDILDENGIEWAVIDSSTKAYHSFQDNAYIFSKILGTEDLFEERVEPVVERCEEIIESASKRNDDLSVAVLYSTSKDIKVDTDNSSVGEITSLLGIKNIVNTEDVVVEGETRVALSFEKLIESDPDFILINTMGDLEGVQEKIAKDLESNPAWNSLKAVQNNEVHYLPKDLFLYKANEKYDEAFNYLVDIFFKGSLEE